MTKNRFSEKSFWNKIAKYGKAAGREVIEKVLWLYYAMKREDCPAWARAVIIGAIAYFILPSDAVPDVLPGIGFTDDLGVLLAAIKTVAAFVDDDVKRQAEESIPDWMK